MARAHTHFLRLLLLVFATLAVTLGDVSVAHAQASACRSLQQQLNALERNADFRGSRGNANDLRALQRDVQRAESTYVRNGCNADAKAGRTLSNQCRTIARQILRGREQVEQLSRSVQTAGSVSQQREAVLQEMARFDCNARSSARTERNRGNLFEQLFDMFESDGFDGEGGVRGEEFNPYGSYHTVRTLCVRKTDGFYWPISFSTLVDYVPNDAEACRAQCPGLDVDLYYHDNPGQEPEQMINQYGERYAALPTAFRFRTDFDTESKCNVQQDAGTVTMADLGTGTSRPVISIRGETIPLPQRDPRRIPNVVQATIVAAADYVSVPLPRRRPAGPGQAAVVPVTAQAQPEDPAARVVNFGGKRVRIVGPDTPYAQLAAAGT